MIILIILGAVIVLIFTFGCCRASGQADDAAEAMFENEKHKKEH